MTFAIVAITLSLLSLCWQVYAIGQRVVRLEERANASAVATGSPYRDAQRVDGETLVDVLAAPCVVCDHRNGFHNLAGCSMPTCRCQLAWNNGKRVDRR